MSDEDRYAIVLAIMLSGYSGCGGFNDEQFQYALADTRRIVNAARKMDAR